MAAGRVKGAGLWILVVFLLVILLPRDTRMVRESKAAPTVIAAGKWVASAFPERFAESFREKGRSIGQRPPVPPAPRGGVWVAQRPAHTGPPPPPPVGSPPPRHERARSGSMDSSICVFQSSARRASAIRSSRSIAPGIPRAISAACAAIRVAITPSRTSSTGGRRRGSEGGTED